MKAVYILFLSVCLSLVSERLFAQHHDHHHLRNEIGINTGVLYTLNDKDWGSGVHAHYFRTLGDHSRWSIGGFVEQTFFLDNHFTLGVGAKYQVLDRLYLSAMPGVSFTKHDHSDHDHDHEAHTHHDDKTKAKFSVHTELVYVLFEWKKFHMGPAIDYSWSKNDAHIMLGIHAAIDF